MFHAFAVNGQPLADVSAWAAYIRTVPYSEHPKLLEGLKLASHRDGLPNFTAEGNGQTLLQWARGCLANWTLMHEIKLAG